MKHRRAEIPGDGISIPGFEAVPAHPRGGIVVLHEAFGLTDYIAAVCQRLADEGYYTLAPNLFHRDGVTAFGYDELPRAKAHMSRLTADGIRTDVAASLTYLRTRGFADASAGLVGFCMGGSIACALAAEDELGATVTFYGAGIRHGRFGFPPLADIAGTLRTPWLGLFGDRDASIPVEDVEHLRIRAASAPVPTQVVRYADAGHGFHCDARPAHYHAPSATDAWQRAVRWLGRYLAASSQAQDLRHEARG
ncbi:MAG: dienelactone hydrolase family protein [Acidothermus sp.]|nr:dienelactone hydrolase family protein [Acidothermus sp.]